MAHAYNRTLIAKLGFADPDRKEPLHDLACRYIGSAGMDGFLRLMLKPHCYEISAEEAAGQTGYPIGRVTSKRVVGTPSFEVPVNKGDDQYKTTVGFVDATIKASLRRHGDRLVGGQEFSEFISTFCIEVKITPTSYSDLLRQINLYREYWPEPDYVGSEWKGFRTPRARWVAAVAYDVSQSYVDMLARERIRVVRLGSRFRDWADAARDEAKDAKVEEI